jgi:hypothetical protein
MLEEMRAKGNAEMQEEAKLFAAFSQWCADTTAKLEAAIETSNDDIDEAEASIKEMTGLAKSLGVEISEAGAKVAGLEEEKKAAQAVRDEQKNAWSKLNAEFASNIQAVEKAMEVLKANAAMSLMQTGAQARSHAMEKVMASTEMSAQQKTYISLLVAAQPNYENTSGGIIGMLEDLKDEFLKEKREAATADQAKQGAHNLLMTSKDGQIQELQSMIDRKSEAKGTALTKAGKAKQVKAATEAILKTDSANEKKVKANCATKAEEEKIRTATRIGEIDAIGQAIEILGGIGNDKKELLQTSVSSFIQLSRVSVHRRSGDNSVDLKSALDIVESSGAKLHSKKLQLLALKMSESLDVGGAMGKVIKMIKGLVEKLKKEQFEEAGQHGQCTKWLAENKDATDAANEQITEETANLQDANATIQLSSKKLQDMAEQQKDSDKMVADATKQRQAESKANALAIADAKEGEEAVNRALVVLREFYEGAAQSTALVQQPVEVSTPQTWDSNFTGNQSGATGVVGMLESVATDFLRIHTETAEEESSSKKAYEEMVQGEKLASAERAANRDAAEKARSEAEVAKAKATEGLAAGKAAKSQAVEDLRTINVEKGCDATAGMTMEEIYEQRKAQREAEIQSLKEALDVLGGL